MKTIFFAFFAHLGCILVSALQNAKISDIDKQDQMTELFQNGKPLRLEDTRGFKSIWNHEFDRDSSMDHSQDILWVEEITQKGTKMAQLVKRQAASSQPTNDEIKVEEVLALIAKNDYEDETKCKKKVKEYCDGLKKIDMNFDKVSSIVKEICKDKEQKKCKDLKDKVKTELKNLEKDLNILENINDNICREYEDKCMFLDVDDHLNMMCYNFRETCYGKKRLRLAYEIFYRAFKIIFNGINDCKTGIKEVCQKLNGYSRELMFLCLNADNTCIYLENSLGDVCKRLNTEPQDNELEGKCQEYLEKCYFYGSSCQNTKCSKIKEKCKEKGITYKAPGSDFNPIKPKPSLLEKIGLKNIYKEAEARGIIIERTKMNFEDLILFMINFSPSYEEQECEYLLENCDKFEYLSPAMKNLCEKASKNKNEKCKELVNVKDRCMNLKSKFSLKLSTELNNDNSKLLSWEELPRFLTREECLEFESECFFLEGICRNTINNVCENVKMACYRMGQDRMLNKLFEDGLRKSFSNIKKCQELVLDSCTKLMGNKKYFVKCLQPTKLCYELSNDIIVQSKELERTLDDVLDSLKEEDCVYLKKDCESITENLISVYKKCATLKEHCEYLRVTKELKNEFLKGKTNVLANSGNCMKALKEKCDGLSGRKKNPFSVSCASQKKNVRIHGFRSDELLQYF